MTNPDTCEVKIEGVWRAVSLNEAVAHHTSAAKRCPACHGPVSISGTYSGLNVQRRVYHRKAHDGCPLQPKSYSGQPSPHPRALT